MRKLWYYFPIVALTFVLGFWVVNPERNFQANGLVIQDHSSLRPMFKDVTATTGLPPVAASGIAFGDYDNDGWVDMLAGGRLFRNTSSAAQISFQDMTSLLSATPLEGSALFVDLDNNGLLDILTTKGLVFMQNNANAFVESSRLMGFSLPIGVHTLSLVDFNGDGWIDIFAGMSEVSISSFVPPVSYVNEYGRRLKRYKQSIFETMPNYVRGIAFADYNNDGKKDGYFSNYRLKPNNLYRVSDLILMDDAPRLGVAGIIDPKKFYDETKKSYYGPRYGHTISSVWADLNNDGLLDLWVSNLVHKYVGSQSNGGYDLRGYYCDDSKIYRNQGPPLYMFTDVRPMSGINYKPIGPHGKFIGDELWAHTAIADFDNDGLQDVYVSQVYDLNYSNSLLYRNLGNFKFQDVSAAQGTRVFDSYAAAWADLNNDGKMDLVQSGRLKNKEAPAIRVLENVMPATNNYLKVKLKGYRSGTVPVTAQVRIYHGKGVMMRQQESVVGTMSQQNDPTIHFGLGQVNLIHRIEVRWPSGKIQNLKNVDANQTLVIEENRI